MGDKPTFFIIRDIEMSLPFEIEKNRDLFRAEVESAGAELIDVTFHRFGGRHILTVTADKAGGITLDDCALISQRLSVFLDEKTSEGSANSLIQGPYHLEVVSPGLDRPLKTEKDFSRAIGDFVLVTFKRQGESIATWRGRVLGVVAAGVEFQLRDGAVKIVPLDDILHAHREIKVNGKRN